MNKRMKVTTLSKNAMNDVKAAKSNYQWLLGEGRNCGCGCYYVNTGGSDSDTNAYANWEGDRYSLVQ